MSEVISYFEAVPVAVAKLVTNELTPWLGTKGIPIVERSYLDWDLDLLTNETPRADVVAVTTELKATLLTRGIVQHTVPIDIAIRQRFGASKQDDDSGRIEIAQLDKLMAVVEYIHLYFLKKHKSAGRTADTVLEEPKILAAPVNKHLRENRQFTGIIRLTFQVSRKVCE